MLVGEIMNKNVKTVKMDEKVIKAFSVMIRNGIRHLPVMSENSVMGVISDRDIRQSLFPWKKGEIDTSFFTSQTMVVKEIMTQDVMSITPEKIIEDAANIFIRYKIGCLPVIENGELLGILTKSDIIDVFITMMECIKESSRIDVLVEDDSDKIKGIEAIIKKEGGEIISVGMIPAINKSETHTRYFRLKMCDLDPIVFSIKAAGYKVISAIS